MLTYLWGALGLFVGAYLGFQAVGTPAAIISGALLAAFCIGDGELFVWAVRIFVIIVAGYLIVTMIGQGLAD